MPIMTLPSGRKRYISVPTFLLVAAIAITFGLAFAFLPTLLAVFVLSNHVADEHMIWLIVGTILVQLIWFKLFVKLEFR